VGAAVTPEDRREVADTVLGVLRDSYLKLPPEISGRLADLSGSAGYMCPPIQLGAWSHPAGPPPLLRAMLLPNGGGIRIDLADTEGKILWEGTLKP